MKELIPQAERDHPVYNFYRQMEIDTLARTLWGEARGEGSVGMHAVANVIMNRVKIAQCKGGFWWGNTIIQVCRQPYQFSCWNRSDPNLGKLLQVGRNHPLFRKAIEIATDATYGKLEDLTNGADHYHAAGITPFWAQGEKPVAVIGRHNFYRLVT